MSDKREREIDVGVLDAASAKLVILYLGAAFDLAVSEIQRTAGATRAAEFKEELIHTFKTSETAAASIDAEATAMTFVIDSIRGF